MVLLVGGGREDLKELRSPLLSAPLLEGTTIEIGGTFFPEVFGVSTTAVPLLRSQKGAKNTSSIRSKGEESREGDRRLRGPVSRGTKGILPSEEGRFAVIKVNALPLPSSMLWDWAETVTGLSRDLEEGEELGESLEEGGWKGERGEGLFFLAQAPQLL